MPMTANESRELAKTFRDISIKLGNYRFDHWDELNDEERKELEDSEWNLLNASSSMVTAACAITLDDAEASVEKIRAAVKQANDAVQTLENVKKLVAMAAAACGLAAAICAKDPGGVKNSLVSLVSAVKG